MALLVCGCNENAAVHSLCSLRVRTPSFNERSECPEEGWPSRAGEESLHSKRHAANLYEAQKHKEPPQHCRSSS